MLNASTDERKRWQEWGWLASPLAVAPLAALAGFLAVQAPAANAEADIAPSAVIEPAPEDAGVGLCELVADDEAVALYWLPCG